MFLESSNWLLPLVLLLWLLVPLPEQEMARSEACWHLGWILPLVARMALLRM